MIRRLPSGKITWSTWGLIFSQVNFFKLATSISDIEIEEVKVFGPLIVLHHLAEEIGLPSFLGEYAPEILSLVYAHCLNYQSISRMTAWFKKTDLAMLLDIEHLT